MNVIWEPTTVVNTQTALILLVLLIAHAKLASMVMATIAQVCYIFYKNYNYVWFLFFSPQILMNAQPIIPHATKV